jgi:predicted transcriptional regulator
MQGKEHIPTDESRKLVRSLSAVGIKYVDIAHKLDITDDTLRKHYKGELEDGRIDANASIGQTLFQQAKNGNTSAAIFWLKTRAGWKETQVTELTGEDGGPIKGLEVRFVAPAETKPSE